MPKKGPTAVARTVLKLKYPIPSPLREGGSICATIVPVAVEEIPSPIP